MSISATHNTRNIRVFSVDAVAATSNQLSFVNRKCGIQSSVVIPKKLEIASVWVDLPTPLVIAQLVHGHHHFTCRVAYCEAH